MEQNSNKIKVLIVAGRMDVGGIENQLMHLLRHADRNRFQLDYTTTDQHPFYEDEIISLGGRCIRIPGTEGKKLLRYCKALYRVMKDGKYDVVHSNELFHSGLVLLTAKLAGVKGRIAHAHSSNQVLGKSLIRRCYTAVMRWLILHCATEFLACSTLAGEFLYGKKTLSKPNYHLIVNSVDTKRFLPDPDVAVAQRNSTDGWKTVLQVGRFSDEKNFAFTARIAAECKRRGEKIRFWFVGNAGTNNPFEREVKEIIAAEGLEDYVQLLGVRKDVNRLMQQADAFILPSKYEGMPLTLIEAQAACLPCVVADTFSHEVDFGVGLIQWIDSFDILSEWVNAVRKATIVGPTTRDLIIQSIESRGFDVAIFAKRVCSFYCSI